MISSKDEVIVMKNTKRFDKVRTSEEYLILCRLEKIEIQKQNKKRRRYTEDQKRLK